MSEAWDDTALPDTGTPKAKAPPPVQPVSPNWELGDEDAAPPPPTTPIDADLAEELAAAAESAKAPSSNGWRPSAAQKAGVTTKAGMRAYLEEYIRRGWPVLPVRAKSKVPAGGRGWPDQRITLADLNRVQFDNVAIHLVKLADVDLDCVEALRIAPHFLPPAGHFAPQGELEYPHHYIYEPRDPVPFHQFIDPAPGLDSERAMCLELRSGHGKNTVFPPSVHMKTGKQIMWSGPVTAEPVEATVLVDAVIDLATAVLVGRHWMKGTMHNAGLALVGWLLRRGLSAERIQRIVREADRLGEGTRDRSPDVRDTIERFQAGKPTTGGPHLAMYLTNGPEVVERLAEWDGWRIAPPSDRVEPGPPQAARIEEPPPDEEAQAEEPSAEEPAAAKDEPRAEEPQAPRASRARPAAPLPAGFVRQYVETALRRTDAPPEAHTLTAVTVLSALAGPGPRLNLAHQRAGTSLLLWSMNLVDSTGGRKTTVNDFGTDVLSAVLGEGAVLPWKGSPERFIQLMAARDGLPCVLARDEYVGLLLAMKSGSYMAGFAQDLIRAYDGLPLTMGRTAKMNRNTGARTEDSDVVWQPYLVLLTAATRSRFISVATMDDVLDGHLARVTFTSGSAEEAPMKARTPEIEAAWRGVIDLAFTFRERAQVVQHVTIAEEVMAAEWQLEKEFKEAARSQAKPEVAAPAMKRLAEGVLRTAGLLAVEQATAGRAEIQLPQWEAAVALSAPWQDTTLALVADIGRTQHQARCDAVLATIRAKPGLTRSALFGTHKGLRAREFDEVLTALEQQHRIRITKPKTGKPGPDAFTYRPGPVA